MIDSDVFDENLRITQAYCEQQLLNTELSVAVILRSIIPSYKGQRMCDFELTKYSDGDDRREDIFVKWNPEPLGYVPGLFKSQIATKKRAMPDITVGLNYAGSILTCEFDETVLDGSSEAESKGFIDLYDLPPIDSWFYLDGNKLYAWIPKMFVTLVQGAIDVNILDLLHWDRNM